MAGLKSALVLRQTQSQTLTMTPQLQQAIRLLQLSTLELRQEIAQTLEQNPLLEINENIVNPNIESLDEIIDAERQQSEVFDPFDNDNCGDNTADISLYNDVKVNEDGTAAHDNLSSLDANGRLNSLDHVRDSHESAGVRSAERPVSTGDDMPYEGETSETLRDHLTWQLNLSPLSGTDRHIAEAIIDGIDDSGYLTEEIEDIRTTVESAVGSEVSLEDVLAVLKVVQHYDPLGVASRNVQECLLTQLNSLTPELKRKTDPEILALAKTVLKDYIDLLSNRDYRRLCQKLSIKETVLQQVMTLITSLNPRPGQGVIREKADFIIPDVVASRNKDGEWVVELNPHAIPSIRLNDEYRRLASRAQNERDRNFFKTHLQEANWFLMSLGKRNDTLLRVAQCIVTHQKDFLDEGETGMHPLILADVAREVDLHESTVSRVTTEKYLHTPRGTYELRYFFSSHVSTDDGGTASATSIRARIKELIAAENPRKPLSDNAIAELLNDQGFMVARRTVAKYREALGIATSNQRKRLI